MNVIALASRPCDSGSPRWFAASGAAAITLLAAVALALFSTEQAVEGIWLEKAIIPGRMFVLVVSATFLLRWSGSSWREVGMRRPASLWRTAALVVVGYLGIGLMSVLVSQLLLPSLGFAPRTLSLFAPLEGNTHEYLYWLLPGNCSRGWQ